MNQDSGMVFRKCSMSNILQTIYQKDMTQPLNILTHYAYDTQDNQNSVTDPKGNITQYYNDDFGRKNKTTGSGMGT
jgi:YD repeat-containing protein